MRLWRPLRAKLSARQSNTRLNTNTTMHTMHCDRCRQQKKNTISLCLCFVGDSDVACESHCERGARNGKRQKTINTSSQYTYSKCLMCELERDAYAQRDHDNYNRRHTKVIISSHRKQQIDSSPPHSIVYCVTHMYASFANLLRHKHEEQRT